jgi:hypothetical protein
MTIRWRAVRASSFSRWEETTTVRPSAARPPKGPDPTDASGSRPFSGSSRMTVAGSPSRAVAMPRRWPTPSEQRPARRPTTSAIRERVIPHPGRGVLAVGLAVDGRRPAGGASRPRMRRMVVDFPAPLGPGPRSPCPAAPQSSGPRPPPCPHSVWSTLHLDHVAHLSHASDARRLDRLARRQAWSAHGHATAPGQAGHRTMRLDPVAEASDVSPRDPSADPVPDRQRVVQWSHADLGQ